jgi:transcription-repair coupling factor (superfamily II helicase)
MIRRMRFLPGSDYVFQFEKVVDGKGSISPYGFESVAGTVFFLAEDGFYSYAGVGLSPIGDKRVNAWFLAAADGADFKALAAALSGARAALDAATATIGELAKDAPRAAAASSVPYLELFGLAAGGALLAKGALAARGGAADFAEARIVVAHGQMHERELERVMREFHAQRANVLLCTTIIETGIDVPTANTIIMHRADRFGLAQLHQLRGRVGRSHHQAYAYLLIPDEGAITKDATKRLEAIQAMEELGSGFFLAMHDLEIRGAGEVLGDSQSGDMQEVGFGLYAEMLNHAVRALKAGREPDLSAPLEAVTEINLHVPALLPADYCGDVNERLTLYKRLANCSSLDALEAMQEELVDRFGKLPDAARALIDTHRLRILCLPLGVSRIDASAETIVLQFVPSPPIPPERIIRLIQTRKDARLAGPDRLRFTIKTPEPAQRILRLREILKALST